MKLLVSGGTGFIGCHFLRQAIESGYKVLAIRRPKSVTRIPLPIQPVWLESELDEAPEAEIRGCTALVHFTAAGVVGTADWEECFAVNVIQSVRLWRRAVAAGVRRIVVCGSCFEYGQAGERHAFISPDCPLEPIGAYSASKAAATMAAWALGVEKQLELVILRPFHVYGEGEAPSRFWPNLTKAAIAGADFSMTSGEQIRDFVSVDYVVRHFLEAATTMQVTPGRPVIANVGSGNPQRLADFAKAQWAKFNARGELRLGAIPYRSNEVMRYVPKLNRGPGSTVD